MDKAFQREKPSSSQYGFKKRRYPIKDIIYHRILSYYHTDNDGNLTHSAGVLTEGELTPGVQSFTTSTKIFRDNYLEQMLAKNDRVLRIQSEPIHLSNAIHLISIEKKANSVKNLTETINAIFKEYEESLKRVHATIYQRSKWEVYKVHQRRLKDFTKDTKAEKVEYLKTAVVDIQSKYETFKMGLNRPILLRFKVPKLT